MQHRTDEVPHDCGRRARARLAEQTAVRSRRVRHTDPPGVRHRNAVRTRQSYPTGTSYMVHGTPLSGARLTFRCPNFTTTVPNKEISNNSIPSLLPLYGTRVRTTEASVQYEEREPATTTHMPISCEMLSSGGCTCQHLRDQRPSTAHPAKGSLVLNGSQFAFAGPRQLLGKKPTF